LRLNVDLLDGFLLLYSDNWGRCSTYDRGCELNFNDLVLMPDTMDDLVFGLINRFTRTILLIIFPITFVLDARDQVDMSATTMLHILFEGALIDFLICLLQLAKAVELAFFELSDILEVRTDKLAETIRFTVPNLALIDSTRCKLVAALSCASSIFPLSSIDIATLEFLTTLIVFLPISEVPGVNIAGLEGQNPEAMLEVPPPLTFVLISVLEDVRSIALLHFVVHLTFVVSTGIVFKPLHEEGRGNSLVL
jgi:hypothetical protein